MTIQENIQCTKLSFSQLEGLYSDQNQKLLWDCPFVLPFWLRTWFSVFGDDFTPYIIQIKSDDSLLGIAPLMLNSETALFMGSETVCDFQDMVVGSETSEIFHKSLLSFLQREGISTLCLGALPPESQTLKVFPEICERLGLHYSTISAGNMSVLQLPHSWDAYLKVLAGKQRHEIRRKLRRLKETGEISYNVKKEISDQPKDFSGFLEMFAVSNTDKSDFLTPKMKDYFEKLAMALARNGMLRLGEMAIDGKCIATTFGFEYEKSMYLYNNGYLPRYGHLSVGLLSKVFGIKHSIKKDITSYNFLKGDEKYKKHLGGRAVSLSRLTIQLDNS